MIRRSTTNRYILAACAVSITLAVVPALAASAATTIDGPIGLGTADPFAILAGSTITNTGSSQITGDVGLSPGTSITGFSSATLNGTIHQTDAVAAQAKVDLTTAYNVAASLTPIATGLGDLTGMSLTPGVYSGGALSLSGALTLAGTAQSVWVFQAASTLTIGSGALITMTGGASACNVFWQVSSSATIDTGAQFIGTVMADASITANNSATITGRLLARTGAVTLDTNTLVRPTSCSTTPGTVRTSPTITSPTPSAGQAGTAYSYTVTASGSPTPSFTVSSGSLPPGLTLNSATGAITGTPTTPGTYVFSITADNGTPPASTVQYSVTIAPAPVVAAVPAPPQLPATGSDPGLLPLTGALVLALGIVLTLIQRLRAASPATRR